MQVVWARPNINRYQSPEMDDRQTVRINRALGLLGYKVIHHAQKTRGQEKSHGIMAVPPLHHRIYGTRIG